ncbi:MAG: MATE family efflux transporter [Rhodobacter sp.]|nr:MATE family efflux transporter [Rhodobacter sp.]
MAATLIGVVDTVMIAPLGTVALAAAGITTAVLIIVISALWGLVTVVGVQIATAEGAGDRAEVTAHVKSGLVLAVLAGGVGVVLMMAIYPFLRPMGQPPEVLAILLPYWGAMALWIVPFTVFFVLKGLFDAVGREWTGVALSYLGVLINVPANYVLIHVVGLGLLGAGLASILSQTVSLLAGVAVWRLSPRMASFRVPTPVSWSRVRMQMRESLPLCLGYAGEGGAYAFIGIMVGWLGATALAAHQVANAVAGLAYVIPLGMAGAVAIRIGQAIGEARQERLRPILKAGLLIVTVWQCGVAVLFVIGGRLIAETLSDDAEVVALAATLLLILALMQIADGIQSTALGALRGMMDNRVPTAITLLAYWPLALPAAFVTGIVLDLGAAGVWLGYTVGIAVAAIALPWRFWQNTAVGRYTTAAR